MNTWRSWTNRRGIWVGITVMTAFASPRLPVGGSLPCQGDPGGFGRDARFRPAGEAQAHADAVVVGEAEKVWPQVVADAEQGELRNPLPGRGLS